MTGDGGRTSWNRRQFLRTAGLTAAAGGLAGCERVTDQEYVADPVVLPSDAQSSLGFSSVVERAQRREIERTVGGQDVTATIESSVSVYAQTGGRTAGEDAAERPLLLRFSCDSAPVDGTTERLLACPATAFDTVGGYLPFLHESVVDPRGIVLFAPVTVLSDSGFDATQALAVAHRSAFSDGPLVSDDGGVLLPDSAFFPDSVFGIDDEWFPNEHWVRPGDDTRSTVALFGGSGDDSETVGSSGSPFEAGEELDAAYVAAPADAFFDAGVSVTDPDRTSEFLGTDVGKLGVSDPECTIDDAGVVVLTDGEHGVPFAYVPGETLFPESTTFPDSVFSDDRPMLSAPLGELFPDSVFFPHSTFFPDSLLNPDSLALFRSAGPLSAVPDPFTVVDSEMALSPSGALLFYPVGPDDVDGTDPAGFRDSTFLPDSSFFPDSVFLTMGTNAHPATSASLSSTFPDSAFFSNSTFSPTQVLHLPGDFGFSAEAFADAGTRVTYARSGTAEKVDPTELAAAPLSLGVLSTPTADVSGRSLNRLARLGLSDLLTSAQAESFLSSSGVGDGTVEWERGPTKLGTVETTLLGDSVTLETHAGVLGGSDLSVVYLHLARVENGNSVVVSVGVHGFDVSDTDRSLVGADGYVSQAHLDRYRADVAAADESLVVR